MKKILILTVMLSQVLLPVLALDKLASSVLIAQSDESSGDSDYDDNYGSDADSDYDDNYDPSESSGDVSTKTEVSSSDVVTSVTADSSWLPTDTVPAVPNIGPSLTAIFALALGIINLVLILLLFRKLNKRS